MTLKVIQGMSLQIEAPKGYCFAWASGLKLLGYKLVRFSGRAWYYEGDDGTENFFYFTPFSKKITYEQALKIIRDELGIENAIVFLSQTSKLPLNTTKEEIIKIIRGIK